MAWKRTHIMIGAGDEPYGEASDDTVVSMEDSMLMLTTTIEGEEYEIMISPELYPAMIDVMARSQE